MSQAPVVYECLTFVDPSKKRKLQRDANGYWEINMGAFNVTNSEGLFYPLLPSVRAKFESGSPLQGAISSGKLYGEMGHPSPTPGQTLQSFLRRVGTIVEANRAIKISSAVLQEVKDENGEPYVLVVGRVRGAGVYMESVDRDLTDPETNMAISVRTLTSLPTMVNGKLSKIITTAVTWDVVNQQGIVGADKYSTASMECLAVNDGLIIDPSMVDTGELLSADDAIGMEGSHESVSRILTDLGWVTVVKPKPRSYDYLNI